MLHILHPCVLKLVEVQKTLCLPLKYCSLRTSYVAKLYIITHAHNEMADSKYKCFKIFEPSSMDSAGWHPQDVLKNRASCLNATAKKLPSVVCIQRDSNTGMNTFIKCIHDKTIYLFGRSHLSETDS